MEQNRARAEAQSSAKDPKPASVSESLTRGKEAIGAAANEAMTAATADLQAIRNDLDNLKDTLTKFMSRVTDEASKSARDVSASVAGQVKDAVGDAGNVADRIADQGSQFASAAGEQAKTLAAEIEALARRNPLGALAGAVAIGFLIGLWGRRS
jgi:ElaB/YqjD/DUF883 family membrane-anchored ribosome-binding protein